ncbi:MAG: hypothetical protein CMM96_05885 [Rickettsiales bacterium]|nr:hypothetical protein [Rickettsiales bacterium]
MIHRYERKFVFTNKSASEVETIVKLIKGNFSEIYNERFINNIYFDKIGYPYLYDNVNGISSRIKIRIRWYGKFFSKKNKFFFERKKKEGFLVIKDSKYLGDLELNPNTNLKKTFKTCLGTNYKKHFSNYNNLAPKLVNRYQRKYFLSRDKNFRVTIDSNQKIGSPKAPISLENLYVNTFKTIVELKYGLKWDMQASQIIYGISERINKNSKYIDGVNYLIKNFKA